MLLLVPILKPRVSSSRLLVLLPGEPYSIENRDKSPNVAISRRQYLAFSTTMVVYVAKGYLW